MVLGRLENLADDDEMSVGTERLAAVEECFPTPEQVARGPGSYKKVG